MMNGTCPVDSPNKDKVDQVIQDDKDKELEEDENIKNDDSDKRRPLLRKFYFGNQPPPATLAPINETKRVKIDVSDSDDDNVSIDFIQTRRTSIRDFGKFVSRIPNKCAQVFWEDWFLLATMGALMGIFSFGMDVSIQKLRELHFHLFYEAGHIHPLMQYFLWVAFTMALVMLAAASCYYISPQAAGSGIPEMKTILRGVVLKEYLTLKTLVAKCIGLVLVLGSGLPIGKEGPLVHIASMVATLLGRTVATFKGAYENETRRGEMLAAACAVGVASTYGAPIGGVLFSIEVTSVFFPLRNYWRGFFAAYCSAIIFRVLAMVSMEVDTLVAFSSTKLPRYDPKEMIAFALLGVLCGFLAAGFIAFHRRYLQLIRETKWIKRITDRWHFAYPVVIVFVIASLKCPLGYGEYFAGGLTPREALDELFWNISWNDPAVMNGSYGAVLMDHWSGDRSSIFVVLALFAVNMFWMTAVATTLPVPAGVFIPVFVTGAAFGRICGEIMYLIFPGGVRADGATRISPGAYAVVGGTAFAGGITHAISSSVVVLEITGQMRYTLPCMVSVLISIAICSHFQPSIYDSVIRIKKLPYLPQIPPTSSAIHHMSVADIMVRRVHYISLESTYRQLRYLLRKMPRLRAFPLVDRPSSLILLGSVSRSQLERVLDEQIGDDAWQFVYFQRHHSRCTTDPSINSKTFNSRATFHGDRAKLLHSLFTKERNAMRKVKSADHLAKLVPSSPKKSRHRSGPETNNEHTSTRASTPTLKLTKAWETRVSAVGTYVSTLSNRLRQSLRFVSTPSTSHSIGEEERSYEEHREWEHRQLNERLNFDNLTVDPAPFQLVERTSLYKAHALFSLLGLNRAYVTCLGRLVGVVALRELRAALERAQDRPEPTTMRRRRSKQISESEHGVSLGLQYVTPADVVRKISTQAPNPELEVRMADLSAAASTVYESALSSRESLAEESSSDQEEDDRRRSADPEAGRTKGPNEYFYRTHPSV